MAVERLGTVVEAAEILGVDHAEVWEMVADGILDATHEDPGSTIWTIWRHR